MDSKSIRHQIETEIKAAFHKLEGDQSLIDAIKADVQPLVYAVMNTLVHGIHNPIERAIFEKFVEVVVKDTLALL